MNAEKITSYVCKLEDDAVQKLAKILENCSWKMDAHPHAKWRAQRDKTTVVAYNSGKLTVQGKGTGDFVIFILEPEILGKAALGYEHVDQGSGEIIPFSPHAGLDESGKGDFFGPLVISAVFVDKGMEDELSRAGAQDSKNIKNPVKIKNVASDIRRIVNGKYAVVSIGPEAYNRMYAKIGNLNRLLAWGHARALENLLEKAPSCVSALADKFGNEKLIANALMEKGRKIELRQQTKAESDIAVAAASILARDAFVKAMERLGDQLGMKAPLGAGQKVLDTAAKIVRERGVEALDPLAKRHFKTFQIAVEMAKMPES